MSQYERLTQLADRCMTRMDEELFVVTKFRRAGRLRAADGLPSHLEGDIADDAERRKNAWAARANGFLAAAELFAHQKPEIEVSIADFLN